MDEHAHSRATAYSVTYLLLAHSSYMLWHFPGYPISKPRCQKRDPPASEERPSLEFHAQCLLCLLTGTSETPSQVGER